MMAGEGEHSSFINHHSSLRTLILAILLALSAGAISALDVPAPPAQWVTDRAGILGAAEEALNGKLRAFEQQSGVQFIIYTFPSLEGEALEDFTIRAAERWKVGNEKYDNGLILFVFVQEQKLRIETGYGLEGTITDAVASRVLREIIAPRFQARDYAGGLNAAADAIIARIQKGEAPVEPVRPAQGQPQVTGIDPFFIILIAVIFFLFALPMLRRGGGRRGRRDGCSGCIFPFFLPGGGITFGGGRGGWGGGGGFGGFSGGGGSFGGGGASGGW